MRMNLRLGLSLTRAKLANKLQQSSDRSFWVWTIEQCNAQLAPNRRVAKSDCPDRSYPQCFFKRDTGDKADAPASIHCRNYTIGRAYVEEGIKLLT